MSEPIIKNTKQDPPGRLRMIVYGAGGVGKTTCAGSFPKPFFISVGSEAGINVLTQLDQECEYTLVTNRESMENACRYFAANYKQKGWLTCVIDTVTLYGRILQMEESGYGSYAIQHNGWMRILGFFLNMRDLIHNCDVHVVWVMHDDESKGSEGGLVQHLAPKLIGSALKEIGQTCDLIAYLERVERAAQKNEKGELVKAAETVRRLWLRCPDNKTPGFTVKNRFEQALPDPCYKPSFASLMERLAPKHITAGIRK